jgi:drug/metabolite transporter (DMT)-like permease
VSTPARWVLVVLAVAGLAVDAYVHLDLASTYDANATTTMSQGDLFRAEAIAAIVVGVLLLVRPRRWTAVLAALVGLAGAVAVVVYRYADIHAFGPFPGMYEPVWYTKKTLSLVGEVVAFVAAAGLALTSGRRTSTYARERG